MIGLKFLEPSERAIATAWHGLPVGLGCDAGFDPGLARIIAAETGDELVWPIRTSMFLDDEGRYFLVALHSPGRFGDRTWIEMSIVSGTMPLRRDVLFLISYAVFDEANVRNLIVRASPSALDLRDTLRRLGFVRIGMLHGRHLYKLTSETIPPLYRRARVRRVH